MKFPTLILSICSCAIIISCNKQGTEPAQPKTTATTHYFSGRYQMYDSTYHFQSTGMPNVYIDTQVVLNRTITIFMDSTAKYIFAQGDTFKFDDTYKQYGMSGYYLPYPTPNTYTGISLTNDTIKFLREYIEQGHSHTKTSATGYRIP
ncbi:MAG: hypothetical protein JST82_09090 [Bacteroidetes bacterium]|nr:hypothetical protein [Bacteroidota bacterium]